MQVLRDLLPERKLNIAFERIIREGTGKEFDLEHNKDWDRYTRPMLEAFAHAKFMVEMAVRYADLREPPQPMPNGYAALLYLYDLRWLSGAGDDARYFQISVPVQPGNSGGALVDERGNVVGVVSAKLSARAALAASGALPENVNYAVKSSFLLSFLESVPEVSAKLKGAGRRRSGSLRTW